MSYTIDEAGLSVDWKLASTKPLDMPNDDFTLGLHHVYDTKDHPRL